MPQETLIPQQKSKTTPKAESSAKEPEQVKVEVKKESKKVYTLWAWILIVASCVAVYIILTSVCTFALHWLSGLIILDFLLLLIVNYANKFQKKLWWLFGLLLAVMVVLVAVSTSDWAWWLWLIVIFLYLITMGTYLIGLLEEKYWRAVVPLGVFLIVMLLILQKC